MRFSCFIVYFYIKNIIFHVNKLSIDKRFAILKKSSSYTTEMVTDAKIAMKKDSYFIMQKVLLIWMP